MAEERRNNKINMNITKTMFSHVQIRRRSDNNAFKLPHNFTTLIILTFITIGHTAVISTEYGDYNDTLTIEESDTEYRTELYENPTTANEEDGSESSVKAFLGKFGYLRPADWNGISPRFINNGYGILSGAGDLDLVLDEFIEDNHFEIAEGSGLEEENKIPFMDDVVVYKPLTYEDISYEEYQSALMKYQKANGLLMTGLLDTDTKLFMEQPRCGVPDRTASLKSNKTLIVSVPEKRGNSLNSTEEEDQNADMSGDDSDKEPVDRRRRSLEEIFEEQFIAGFDEDLEENEGEKSSNEFAELFSIPEAEPAEDSRVKSLERILMALRNSTAIKDRTEVILKEMETTAASPPTTPDLVHRAMLHARRKKRSYLIARQSPVGRGNPNGWLIAYAKPVITWRLVREWPSTSMHLSTEEVRFTIKLAFRMWSEVLPRTFVEDNTSPMSHVDILLGFGKKRHNRCPVEFLESDYTNEYAHAWPLPKAEVHFNDDQPFRSFEPKFQISSEYNTPIDLLKVAVHEIGHTLGLPHTKHDKSIMNPVYRPHRTSRSFELEFVDRSLIQQIYGKCENPFDVVFDWVRPFKTATGTKYKYNTFFFRKTWHWLYENKVRRPRYGDPKLISEKFSDVMKATDPYGKLDAIVQLRGWNGFAGPTFIFKGNMYMEYDTATERTFTHNSKGERYPRYISQDFPGIPYPLDTAIYKYDEKLLYFFKGDIVYKFNYAKKMVVAKNLISKEFRGWGGAAPLPSNINAAYYSYNDFAYYFFKGQYYWKMADKRDRSYNKGKFIPIRAVGPRILITTKWKDLCDVHPSELSLDLPKTN